MLYPTGVYQRTLRGNDVQRTPRVRIEVDRWDWERGQRKDSEPVNITSHVQSYTWQKTIKTPVGGAEIQLFPQRQNDHVMDALNPQDIVRIYEFDTLKFQGYIRRINYSGSITPEGQPQRSGNISATSFGGILMESSLGLNLGNITKRYDALISAAIKMAKQILDSVHSGISYSEMVHEVITGWFSLIEDIAETAYFAKYVRQYFDYDSLVDFGSASLPREYMLFRGTEDSITLWQILQNLIEAPFNELWCDDGPRYVSIDGRDIELGEGKVHLVLRPTPFDGTVLSGVVDDRFQRVPRLQIPKLMFPSFNFTKSSDDVYSLYITTPAAFDLQNEALRTLIGDTVPSETNLQKYLLRPLINQLYYIRMTDPDDGSLAVSEGDVQSYLSRCSQTLANWFEHNDQYLSGTINLMVPEKSAMDPRIGNRVSLEGVQGDWYCEGVSHQWNYGGPMISSVSVTRGWNRDRPIQLSDRIFNREIQA